MNGQREDWPERDPEQDGGGLLALLERMPAEVRGQLDLNLELLDASDAFHDALPDEYKARVAAMTDKQAHEQFVASLSVLPPATRQRIRHCVAWLRELVEEVSPPPAVKLHPADVVQRSPREVPLQLVSCPGYAATA